MSLHGFFNPYVVAVHRNQSVAEAAMLMRKKHVGCLVVVEEDHGKPKPVGIVTDRDLSIEIVAFALSPKSVLVEDVMIKKLVTIRHDAGLYDAVESMHSHAVKRLPVVDADGYLVGVVSMSDMLKLLAWELDFLASIGKAQRDREGFGSRYYSERYYA